jgi:hypothetical protein
MSTVYFAYSDVLSTSVSLKVVADLGISPSAPTAVSVSSLGYYVLAGHRTQDTEHWTQDTEHWTQEGQLVI